MQSRWDGIPGGWHWGDMPGTAWPHPVITVTSISTWLCLIHSSCFCFSLSAIPGIFIREARCCLLITSWPRVPSLFLLSNDQPPECKLWPCSCPLGWPGFSHHWKGKLHESMRCSVPRLPKLLPLEAMSVISVKIAGKRTDFFFF